MNFLPEEDKKFIKKDYASRLWAVVGFGIFFIISIADIFLFFPLVSLVYQRKINEQEAFFIKRRLEIENGVSSDISIQDLNKKIDVLSFAQNNSKNVKSLITQTILRIKTSQLSITKILIDNDKVSVAGTAETRSAFINFVEALRKEDFFKKVDAPISSLLKDKDVEFAISIQL